MRGLAGTVREISRYCEGLAGTVRGLAGTVREISRYCEGD